MVETNTSLRIGAWEVSAEAAVGMMDSARVELHDLIALRVQDTGEAPALEAVMVAPRAAKATDQAVATVRVVVMVPVVGVSDRFEFSGRVAGSRPPFFCAVRECSVR